MTTVFRRRTVEDLAARVAQPAPPDVLATVSVIAEDVRRRGEAGVRQHAERLDGLRSDEPLVVPREQMQAALQSMMPDERDRLERIAQRIRAFAVGQRASLGPYRTNIPGGAAGHSLAAVERAGCYAPGGRYPLPSSLLMTALTARAAGVAEVWVASPRPGQVMLAAAALADVDGLVRVGGAQAIFALAFGAGPVPPCDVVVGPGNAWVSAAKQMVAGRVGIDTIAGPSELVVLADDSADAGIVAADLLAQAEHDPCAIPVLVTTSGAIADGVQAEMAHQLATLPTADVAIAALANGGFIVVPDLTAGIAACDLLAPEHLALHVKDAESVAPRLRHYGAIFIGEPAAEVLGDYGAGPNHVLPTGRASRFTGGLSVLSFLRVRTWMAIHDRAGARGLIEDAAWLGRVEGLEAHARSAERRLLRYVP
jgi:phosphoribosyl-ATP pyrophosphohydrolase/phosphoribosyl-AMP cyclohydrolase/histidinol dehydrogenase